MVATPDVAMTLALLGTRLSSVGMTLSAPWSNLLPRMDDKCLLTIQQSGRKTLVRVQLRFSSDGSRFRLTVTLKQQQTDFHIIHF